MKIKIGLGIICTLLLFSCKNNQEVRRPVSHSSGVFMKKSVAKNKKLVASEEQQIKAIIKQDSKNPYVATNKGYWYSYKTKNDLDTITPKKGDIAFFNYEIKHLDGEIIYSELELRPQTYYVDKQDVLIGLRDGIKLMHRGEIVNFLFPSHKAYGYRGDTKKIGPNTPLLITVNLRDFKSEVAYKKEIEDRKKADLKAQQNAEKISVSNAKTVKTLIKSQDSLN